MRSTRLPHADAWLAVAAGLALCAALPPHGTALAALAFGPLLHAATYLGAGSPWRAASMGALSGVVFGACAFTFVSPAVRALAGSSPALSWLAYVAAVATHAVPPALACGLARRCAPEPQPVVFAACLATAFAMLPMVFPYGPAVLLVDVRPLSAWAGIGGAACVDFLSVAPLAALVPDARWSLRRAGFGLLALAAVLGGGAVRLHGLASERATLPHVSVAMVQTDVSLARGRDPNEREARLFAMRRATAQAVRAGASVVVFPESSYPHVLGRYGAREPGFPLDVGARHHDIPVLVGATTQAGGCARWNGAVLFDATGARVALADKQRRMPFADVRGLPALSGLPGFPSRCGELRPAVARAPLPLPGDPAVLVCYDEVEPAPARRLVGGGAGYLIGITNDAWYEGTRQPHLQKAHARLRALETGRDLVRVANRVGTGLARADGRFVSPLPQGRPAVGVARVAIRRDTNLATRLGVLPVLVLLTAVVLYGRNRSGGGGR